MASTDYANEIPEIQVIDKANYFTQTIVSLPNHKLATYGPLAPSSMRVRTRIMALTANNMSYAMMGYMLHWWDVNPLPSGMPEEYADSEKWGRLGGAWGWSEVLDSTHDAVPKGSFLWGYHAIGTLVSDLTVKEYDNCPGHINVTNAYRQTAMPLYNRYFIRSGAAADKLRKEIAARAPELGYDSVGRIMFETAYLMARYSFGGHCLKPGRIPVPMPWTEEVTGLKGATVVLLGPGTKVGLCFAREMKLRPKSERPAWLIGAASKYSKGFVETTGLYDAVVDTEGEEGPAVLDVLGVPKDSKVIFIDFGGRVSALTKWATYLSSTYSKFLMVSVGGEIQEVSHDSVIAGFAEIAKNGAVVNMGDIRDQAMELEGDIEFFRKYDAAFEEFRAEGLPGLTMRWGEGLKDVSKGWDEVAHGKVGPNEGLVYAL